MENIKISEFTELTTPTSNYFFSGYINSINKRLNWTSIYNFLLSIFYTKTELNSVTTTSGADLIGIKDSGNKYTGTTVETALQEVKTLADTTAALADTTAALDPVITVTLTGNTTGTATGTMTNLGNTTISVNTTGLDLGETSTTAYVGDKGKTAYDHTSLTNNPHGVTKTQIGLGSVDNTADINKSVNYSATSGYADGAGAVVSGVYTTGTYANPSWITSLADTKITGGNWIKGDTSNLKIHLFSGTITGIGNTAALTVPNDGLIKSFTSLGYSAGSLEEWHDISDLKNPAGVVILASTILSDTMKIITVTNSSYTSLDYMVTILYV